eukprot:TRINITY_DN8533_c0_g1_i1.p1 TRINITY_DN8533_c0_g1~~TRINITY_DN8533_c0_g1_i1.p1  ORF type:complete len:550 (-),score=158.16 TRINITY_DN8533_c0_g1_i1:41-1690(-)
MVRKQQLVALLLVVAAACAAAESVQYAQRKGWRAAAEAPAQGERVRVTVALNLQHMDLLQAFLARTADPSSPQYGQWMTREAVAELTSPAPAAVDAVVAHFAAAGVSAEPSAHRDFLAVEATVAQIASLFGANLARYVHTSGATIVRSTNGYTVPEEIAPYVACIAGLSEFPKISEERVITPTKSLLVTPDWIRDRYSVTIPTISDKTNLQAVVSFLEQYYSNSDLQEFFLLYEKNMIGDAVAQQVGKNNESMPGLEASLDVQYLMGVTVDVPTWVYYTDGLIANNNEPWLDWFQTLESQDLIPWVFSMSYQDLEPTVDRDYASRVNDEFMKYSAAGHTFVTGSGDWGVGCSLGVCNYFTPDFPSSSPYVVSLGGTTMSATATDTEIGVYFSSGGFSDYFTRPSYQDDVVAKYLASGSVPPRTYFNASGRGFPDLSTIATNFGVVMDGKAQTVGGTSAATPTFAAMLSLINQLRLNAGQPTLGWVNPFLYKAFAEGAYTDITSNQAMDKGCCNAAFKAVTAWDPMTGMGVPKFDVLAKLAMNTTFCNLA